MEARTCLVEGGAMPKFKLLAARIAPLAAIVLAAGAGGKFH
jgi:hypothetical protein